MSTLLGFPIVWQPDDYIFFQKCGEITISPDIQNIGLNCLFCKVICLQLDIFLQHLQEKHMEEVFKLYEKQNSNTSISTTEILVNLNNSLATTNAQFVNVQSQEQAKENCLILNMEETFAQAVDLNSVYNFQISDLSMSSQNQDLENLITFNPLENLANNVNSPTLTNSVTPASNTIISNCTSASFDGFKCLPNDEDNECEIGDGEDSGIIMVQSPCNSDYCAGLSDCMSFTEDSSSKSPHKYEENWLATNSNYENHQQTNSLSDNRPSKESPKSNKRRHLKTPAVRKAMNNKDLVVFLLDAYKKNENLWNPKHFAYKYNAPRSLYTELSQPLLNEMKYSLTGGEIFSIIEQFRGRYRRELKKIENHKGKHKTRLWYFEHMEFLRPVIEAKRKKGNNNDDLDATENVLTNRQILSHLLDFYRQYKCLWNPQDLEYGICNRTKIFEEISKLMKQSLNVEMTNANCMHEIQKLRIRYRKELRIFYKLKGLYIPKLWCFDEMQFLRPAMEEKITNNLKKATISSLIRRKHDILKANEMKFDNLEQQLKFIEIYRSYNSLWEVENPDFRSTNYRSKVLNEMLVKVNSNFGDKHYKLEQLEKTIYLLRKEFSREKHKRLADTPSNRETNMSFILYEKLSEFLSANLGPFRCEGCAHLAKTYDQYKIHKSKHDGSLPFICSLCGKGFQMPGNLTVHIRRHRRDFPYSCQVCKKPFATSTEVNIHMRSHTGERPYVCESCKKTFKTWSFYDLHRRSHINQSNFHCPICDKSFYERNRFTDHMNIHLNIRKHSCENCGKSFTTLGNLKKHLDLHATVKKYTCQSCGRSFAQFASLRWHCKTKHEQ